MKTFGTVVRLAVAVVLIVGGIVIGMQMIKSGSEMKELQSKSSYEGEGGTVEESFDNSYGMFVTTLGYGTILLFIGLAVGISGLPTVFADKKDGVIPQPVSYTPVPQSQNPPVYQQPQRPIPAVSQPTVSNSPPTSPSTGWQ